MRVRQRILHDRLQNSPRKRQIHANQRSHKRPGQPDIHKDLLMRPGAMPRQCGEYLLHRDLHRAFHNADHTAQTGQNGKYHQK